MSVEWGSLKTCLVCFSREGISVRLEQQNEVYVCPRNPEHRFIIKDGELKRLSNE